MSKLVVLVIAGFVQGYVPPSLGAPGGVWVASGRCAPASAAPSLGLVAPTRRALLAALAAPALAVLTLGPAQPAWAGGSGETKLGPIYIKMATPRDIQNIFQIIASEPAGESMKILTLTIQTEDFEKVSSMARLYDTYLRKDVLQPLVGRLGPKADEADVIQKAVLATFISIDAAAKRADKPRCLELVKGLKELILQYAELEPASGFREAEAAKLMSKGS
ncbi:hypothetical protein T492DRAFT_981831, partial [Pavlovales sp. CCMP2436]|mmetsp:Transcript_31011/g.71210  ORF Transcript_31011/g.71210 Transcript_31011/m.71210 type:complete len:220 (+) Transcript_31011:3-662(+)